MFRGGTSHELKLMLAFTPEMHFVFCFVLFRARGLRAPAFCTHTLWDWGCWGVNSSVNFSMDLVSGVRLGVNS